ncbi:MAG: hypothetical protein L6Q83_12480, partial [Gammaproteobacteria bacterium]|nr:hypothetical protein [Gammaproteobacteria bacterium]
MTAVRLNPTLVTEAYFSVAFEGDHRRTRFDLGEHPEIAPWLLSVLEFVLWKQGRLADERQISPPPGGATLQRLIEGRIVLAEQRADGGLALRLSPEMDLRLALYARRHRQPAINAMLGLAEEPDVTRWLLQHYGAGRPAPDLAQLDATLLRSLRQHGVLVDEPPDAEAFYPDPAVPVDLTRELAPAARIYRQSAGQPVPPAVRAVLGRHTPALPPGLDLLWSEDAGTGLVYPAVFGNDHAAAQTQPPAGAGAARRAALWQEQRASARVSLRTKRYAELRALVPEDQQEKLRRYLRQLVERGYFPALGDGQVERRAGLHNPATFAAFHHGLARLVTAIC